MNNPMRAAVAGLSLTTIGLLGLLAVPTVAAHDCYELVPTMGGCGGCPQGHDGSHTFGTGSTWCSSDAPPTASLCSLLRNIAIVDCEGTELVEIAITH